MNKKRFINILLFITGLLIIGVGIYYTRTFNRVPNDALENYSSDVIKNTVYYQSYEKGQIISKSNKGKEFYERIVEIKYFDNNRFVLFKTLSWDMATYYLIDQSTGTNLLSGKNKYLISNFNEDIKYFDDTNELVIRTFTNDLLGDGFDGVLIINLRDNIVNKIEVKKKDYSSEEVSRVKKEVDELFEKALNPVERSKIMQNVSELNTLPVPKIISVNPQKFTQNSTLAVVITGNNLIEARGIKMWL
ncbi:MAG TPA: hypothetical protein PJ997_02730 [Candidatus Paceibacterota bacterium]|nr:hypothetical protein [Candidatus Paceibacterota bacterium]HMP19227.1 hypothetical protein [Candidatus Paceibacterota bacterium]HMP85513.1 hypothetical protein [Candidatus Paceibacterota bacterium]